MGGLTDEVENFRHVNLSPHSMAVLRLCLSTLKQNQAYLPTLVTNARVFLHQSPLLFICTNALSTRARTKDTVSVQDNTSDVERNPIQRISKGLDEKMPIGPDGPNLGQLSEPPVLFIGKYQRAIDTRELELRDELSDIAKKGKMTPESLTHQKVCHDQLVVYLSSFVRCNTYWRQCDRRRQSRRWRTGYVKSRILCKHHPLPRQQSVRSSLTRISRWCALWCAGRRGGCKSKSLRLSWNGKQSRWRQASWAIII